MIKKVFVVHKTHLDIGFTDSAANVLRKYVDTFIPRAIDTAYACNADGKKNFVWTVGSFLIDYYLQHAEHPERLVQAIEDGYIAWHGLALTTHTELMDEKLFRYELDIAKKLDARFGKKTIAAKMTDVPGHTHAIVPYLAEYGIEYLHIGINSSSKIVKVPPLFRLRYGDREIVVNYASAYGGADTFGEYALEFAHTADNMGPPTPERVWAEIQRLQEKYPGAEIVSSTIDEFAREVLKHKDSLPVVTEEVGDTWIHGIGTDPYKVGAYGELLALRDEWLASEPDAAETTEYRDFCRNLMLICEHTWGRDVKRWLSDYKNWSKEDFWEARRRDLVTAEDTLPAGKLISDAAVEQTTFQNGQCRYSAMEESWQEQRDYVDAALKALPSAWREKGEARLVKLRPEQAPQCQNPARDRAFSINGYGVEVRADGSLMVSKTPALGAAPMPALGRLTYNVYGWDTVNQNYLSYNRDLERTRIWSEADFSKPGLYTVADLKDEHYVYELTQVEQWENGLRIWLQAPEQAASQYGAPRTAVVTYTFGEDIAINLQWFDKDASRIPEGLFFDLDVGAENLENLRVYKLGLPVDPYCVREGGNRKLHAAAKVTSGKLRITSVHAPLLSVGGEHLYDENEDYGDLDQGISYVLFNNRWGTNFRIWYEENASFDLRIGFQD